MDLTDIYNPLHLNIPKQVGELLSHEEVCSFLDETQLQVLQRGVASSTLLAVLSHLLCQPRFTQLISDLFRPLIIDLCARLLDYRGGDDAIFIALAHLIALHPEIYP
jgi:midasin